MTDFNDMDAYEAHGEAERAVNDSANVDVQSIKKIEMTKEEQLQTLRDDVLGQNENEDVALFRFLAPIIGDDQGVSDLEECYSARESGKLPFQINGFGHRSKGETLVLCIAKYEGLKSPETTPEGYKITLVRKLQNYLRIIDSEEYKKFPEGGNDREIADKIAKIYKKCNKILFVLLTDYFIDGKAMKRGTPFKNREMEAVFIGPEQFFQTLDIENASAGVSYDVRNTSPNHQPLDFTEPPVQANDFRVMHTFLSGKLLFDMYSRHGDKIMRANIRALLSAMRRNRVNVKIAKTLRETPELFSAMNNGLTMLATGVDYETVQGRKYIKTIHGPQIVNGGQTTGTIFAERMSENEACFVSCKIIVYDAEKNPEFARAVAQTSNDQTKINATDLSSNDAYFVSVEVKSRTVKIRNQMYYFARVRSQYETEMMKRKALKSFKSFQEENPKQNVFVKSDIAAAHSLFADRPHHVNAGAESNFQKWASSELPNLGTVSVEDYKSLVAKIILWRQVKKIVDANKARFKDYRNYIANFTVSLIAQHIDSDQFLLDVWNDQSMPRELSDKIVDLAGWVDKTAREISGDRAVSATSRLQGTWDAIKLAWQRDLENGAAVDLSCISEPVAVAA